MKRLILALTFVVLSTNVFAQSKWVISNIPEELLKDANAVMRWDEGVYEIKSISSATYYVHEVITILNHKAKGRAFVGVGYDKNRKIKTLEAKVYNSLGLEIKRVKKGDFIDESNISGYSLFEDNRTKSVNLAQDFYPYTIEFEYELEYNYTYITPKWFFQGLENCTVEKSIYTVKGPKDLLPKYRILNTEINTQQSEKDGITSLTWEMNNLAALTFETLSPSLKRTLPFIEFQTDQFDYLGYKGSMKTWKDYGVWEAQLLVGRDQLPAETVAKIKEITDPLKDDKSKIKAVYEYVQSKTRYVSIQVGIGGFQPFEASLVDKVGYGDCKALSNYTLSLLKSIGINSHYASIYAGDEKEELSKDYVIPTANHVILCVPNNGDTVWLECTSQIQPFGFLGSFTDDRDVILITENGGVLARTPRYPQESNQMKTLAIVNVEESGDAKASININYQGLQSEYSNLNFYIEKSAKEQKDWIYENTEIGNFDIVNFSFEQDKQQIPLVKEKLDINIKSLASVSGKRMFIQPNLLHKRSFVPKSIETRTQPVVWDSEYINTDSIVYNIPTNIYAEHLPEDIHIESPFGQYDAEFIYEEGKLIYKRTVKMIKGTFPPDHYNKLIEFCKEMVKADKVKVVFNNRT